MHFLVVLFSISIIYRIFNAQAQPENLFTLGPSRLDTDAYLDNDSQWSSNELLSGILDLAINSLPQDSTTTNNVEDLSTDFLDPPFTTNPSETLFISSACSNQGSVTADFLQTRDEASCSDQQQPLQAGLKVPNIFDANFLPQSLGGAAARGSDSPNEGSGTKTRFLDENYIGPRIPEAFRLREDPELCPPEIFLVSITPVCENPVTGRIEEGNVYPGTSAVPGFVATNIFNVIPCMYFGVS